MDPLDYIKGIIFFNMLDKEREPIMESGYSEEQVDLAVDMIGNNDQVKAGNIYVAPQKPKKIEKAK